MIVSSGAGLRAFPWAAGYGATKAAQRGFAEALRHELSGSGVSVTTVFPGEIATALHDHEKDSLPDWYHGGASGGEPPTGWPPRCCARSSATAAPSTTRRSSACSASTASPRARPTRSCAACAAARAAPRRD